MAGVQFLANGATSAREDTAAPTRVNEHDDAADGSHILTAVARDAAGNLTTSAPVTITVSNTAPTAPSRRTASRRGSGGSAGGRFRGNNLNGALTGATWSTAGRYGNALSFDGVNDWVTVADHALLDLTTAMTVSAWVRPTAAAADYTTVLLKERPGGLAYALYAADGAGRPPSGLRPPGRPPNHALGVDLVHALCRHLGPSDSHLRRGGDAAVRQRGEAAAGR